MSKSNPADTISKIPSMSKTLGAAGFRNLLVSTTVAAFGGSVSMVAVSWIVYFFTHNAIYIAYLGMAGVIPGIVFGLLAGVIADRYDRKLLMVSSDLIRMVSMASLSIFLFFIGFSFPLILAIMVVVNTFTTIFSPASQAILPMIVSKEKLEDANGLLQGSASVFQSVGSAAGGLVVAYLGALWGLGINSMTYALSAIFLFQIIGEFKGRTNRDQSKGGSFSGELVEGMGYMKQHIPILEVTLGSLLLTFLEVSSVRSWWSMLP
jgi:MFS family permease